MAFTVQEIENVANAAIDFHYKTPKVRSQSLQDKPLLKALQAKEKTFPGGKGQIDVRVKGVYSTTIQGFEHNDPVSYSNPANIRKATVPWKLIHSGIEVTMHELLIDGISVSDTSDGSGEKNHSDREVTVLANLMQDKVEDLMEGSDRGYNEMYWQDGTQDPTLIPGITSFVLDDPTSATVVNGIDQGANDWWRNRASLGIVTTTPSDLNIASTLQTEWRQLRRFGGRPDLVLCGSDWLDAMEEELRAKGYFTQDGWASSGKIDVSVADLAFKGASFIYDPTLDDLGKAKYCYVLDTKHIYPMAIEGESFKKHTPARPENKYVFYRAMTYAGGLVCDQRNAQGVYSIA